MLMRWAPLWVFPVLIVFAFGTVWLRLSIVRTTYSINQVHQSLEHTYKERENLQLKLAALKSPGRLESLARNKFGLRQPRADQIIHMNSSNIEIHVR